MRPFSSRYTLEERSTGLFRYRVIYHLGYISRAGNDSIVCRRFRTHDAADRWMKKAADREWKRAER